LTAAESLWTENLKEKPRPEGTPPPVQPAQEIARGWCQKADTKNLVEGELGSDEGYLLGIVGNEDCIKIDEGFHFLFRRGPLGLPPSGRKKLFLSKGFGRGLGLG